MANTRSQAIIDFAAGTKQPVRQSHGRIRFKRATLEQPATIANGDQLRFFRVMAHDVPVAMRLMRDDLATTAETLDFGVRTPSPGTADPAQISGAADNCLTDNLDVSTAALDVPTDILFLGATSGDPILNWGLSFWELAGIATEPVPGTMFELVAIAASITAPLAGTVTLGLLYTAGD